MREEEEACSCFQGIAEGEKWQLCWENRGWVWLRFNSNIGSKGDIPGRSGVGVGYIRILRCTLEDRRGSQVRAREDPGDPWGVREHVGA